MNHDQKEASLIEARAVLDTAITGTLSVIDLDTGGPFGALVNVATDDDGKPVLLLSRLARHVRCLEKDNRASLMVAGERPAEGDPLTGLRATLTGTMIAAGEDVASGNIRSRYLAHHPYAELYADFGDFGFWRFSPEKIFVVAGFGRIFAYDAETFFAPRSA